MLTQGFRLKAQLRLNSFTANRTRTNPCFARQNNHPRKNQLRLVIKFDWFVS